MKTFNILLFFVSILAFGQNDYYVVTIEKKDKNFPNERPKYLWVVNLSENKEKPAPVYFWNIGEEEREYCSKYNNINIFSEDPKIVGIDKIENKIYKNRIKVCSFVKRFNIGERKKPVIYKVYVTPITGYLFSCNINQKEGIKINYQGKVYFLDEKFEVKKELLRSEFIKLDFIKWFNYDFIKTYPYSQ